MNIFFLFNSKLKIYNNKLQYAHHRIINPYAGAKERTHIMDLFNTSFFKLLFPKVNYKKLR